ncbi:MAG: hypothetical protein KDB79_01300 [Acidobacteria bacterium]|nr:hypothetical protein [Acidobacteriota bacterium]
MTAKDHNRLLGIFFLIKGGLVALGGIMVAFIYGGIGTMMLSTARKDEEQMIGAVFVVAAIVATVAVIAFAVFYLFTGWKLYKEKSVGRVLCIVASCLSLLNVPLGTALGVYGLWFMFSDEGKAFYDQGNMMAPSPPPPPNSWQ